MTCTGPCPIICLSSLMIAFSWYLFSICAIVVFSLLFCCCEIHYFYGRELIALTNALNALILQTIKFFNRAIKINHWQRRILCWQYSVVTICSVLRYVTGSLWSLSQQLVEYIRPVADVSCVILITLVGFCHFILVKLLVNFDFDSEWDWLPGSIFIGTICCDNRDTLSVQLLSLFFANKSKIN